MIKSPMSGLYLQPLYSPISESIVTPITWIEEIEKNEYPYSDIVLTIIYYEFIISCLIETTSFFCDDKSLLETNHYINNKYYNDFAKIFFNRAEFYESLLTIIRFNNTRSLYRNYGLLDSNEESKKLYDTWNMYYKIIFGDKNDLIKIKDKLTEINKIEKIDNFQELKKISGGITIPKINFNGIINLLDFLERKQKKYISFLTSEDNSDSLDINYLEISKDSLLYKTFSYFYQYILWQSGKTIETQEQINYLSENIDIKLEDMSIRIRDDNEKTRTLIIDKATDITNEIISAIDNIPYQYKYEHPRKIWMIARHPNFIPLLNILIETNLVENNPEYYTWIKTNKEKGFGKNILAFFIYENILLNYSEERQLLNKDNDLKVKSENGVFSESLWEPFNIGFNLRGLQRDAQNTNIPLNYNKFIQFLNDNTKSGIKLELPSNILNRKNTKTNRTPEQENSEDF